MGDRDPFEEIPFYRVDIEDRVVLPAVQLKIELPALERELVPEPEEPQNGAMPQVLEERVEPETVPEPLPLPDPEPASETEKPPEEALKPPLSWKAVLRPWAFCLFFLVLIEGAARYTFDYNLSMQKERFDNFPSPATEDTFVRQMARDKAFKVVVIGDSTLVGSKILPKHQTIPRYLEEALQREFPQRPIHVWNFSLPGARSTDMLCMLKKAWEGKPDLVVVQENYYTSCMGIRLIPLYFPWLASNLPEVPEPIRPFMEKQEPKQRLEEQLTNFVEKNVRLIGMRHTMSGLLFGVQPRVPYDAPNPMIMIAVDLARRNRWLKAHNWKEKGFTIDGFSTSYGRPFEPDEMNGSYYRFVMEELGKSGVPALTYQTPQNPAIAEYVSPQTYAKNKQILAAAMAYPTIPHHDFTDLVPSELFEDNDHMLADGNKMLGEALAKELKPLIEAKLGKRN